MFGGGYGKKPKSEEELRRERAIEGLKKEKADRDAQQVVVNPIEPGSCCDSLLKIVQYVVCCCGCCSSWDDYYGVSHVDWDSPQ